MYSARPTSREREFRFLFFSLPYWMHLRWMQQILIFIFSFFFPLSISKEIRWWSCCAPALLRHYSGCLYWKWTDGQDTLTRTPRLSLLSSIVEINCIKARAGSPPLCAGGNQWRIDSTFSVGGKYWRTFEMEFLMTFSSTSNADLSGIFWEAPFRNDDGIWLH